MATFADFEKYVFKIIFCYLKEVTRASLRSCTEGKVHVQGCSAWNVLSKMSLYLDSRISWAKRLPDANCGSGRNGWEGCHNTTVHPWNPQQDFICSRCRWFLNYFYKNHRWFFL